MEELQEYILKELKDINANIGDLRIEIAMLKVKSGVWGLLAGLIPVVIYMIIRG